MTVEFNKMDGLLVTFEAYERVNGPKKQMRGKVQAYLPNPTTSMSSSAVIAVVARDNGEIRILQTHELKWIY